MILDSQASSQPGGRGTPRRGTNTFPAGPQSCGGTALRIVRGQDALEPTLVRSCSFGSIAGGSATSCMRTPKAHLSGERADEPRRPGRAVELGAVRMGAQSLPMPVGRVGYLHMGPMTFTEHLEAVGAKGPDPSAARRDARRIGLSPDLAAAVLGETVAGAGRQQLTAVAGGCRTFIGSFT